MEDDYNRIKNYLDSHNWHLKQEDFYNLIKDCPNKVGYKINNEEHLQTETQYSIHFWMITNPSLYGDIWFQRYNK